MGVDLKTYRRRVGVFKSKGIEVKQLETSITIIDEKCRYFKLIKKRPLLHIGCIIAICVLAACRFVVSQCYRNRDNKATTNDKTMTKDKESQTDNSPPKSYKEASNNRAAPGEFLCSKIQRKMKLIETDMVTALKHYIYPKMRNDEWKSFLMNIDANFQHPTVDQHSESFIHVFSLLTKSGLVSLGNYEKLLEPAKKIDVKAEDIIVNATKEIKVIQDSTSGTTLEE